MTEKREDCGHCGEHVLLEKYAEYIPPLLTFMNKGKMAGFIIGLTAIAFMLTTFGMISTSRSENTERQSVHEKSIKEQQEKISCQVEAIRVDVVDIKTNVAVMVRTFELSIREAAKERDDNKRKIDRLIEAK